MDGPVGAFSNISFDGNRQALELVCDTVNGETGAPVSVVCALAFHREDGFTSEHFVIARVSAFTSLVQTTFIENSGLQSGEQHFGRLKQFSLSCEADKNQGRLRRLS